MTTKGSQAQFRTFAMQIFTKVVLAKLTGKGEEYTEADESALANFDASATMFNSTAERELMGYATKHWSAISLWTTAPTPTRTTKIAERALDIIIYMLLLLFALQERHGVEFDLPKEPLSPIMSRLMSDTPR